MPDAVSNTSPLIYLHRIGVFGWLPEMFDEIWIPDAVVNEFAEGRRRGYEVPDPANYKWLGLSNPKTHLPNGSHRIWDTENEIEIRERKKWKNIV